MRIIAYLIVGPGEADHYLEPVLKQLHWTDGIAVCLNNADEKTSEMVHRYATFVHEDNREWGLEQWRIKQEFLKEVGNTLKPDWVWCLDADEIFDPRFDRQMAETMASGHDVGWYFFCLQLWNDGKKVRLDLSFPNIRFYKFLPELGLSFHPTALHCGLAPKYAYNFGSQSGLYFKHYGLMTLESRIRKIARYDRYDPKAKFKGKSWYDALRNEKARSVPIEEAVARIPEFIYKKKPLKAIMKQQKTIYMFRNFHGKPVPAVGEMQRDQFRKIGYQELQPIVIQSGGEAPVYEPRKVESASQESASASPPKKRGRPRKAQGSEAGAGAVSQSV